MLIPLGFLASSGAAAGAFDLLESTVLTGSQASVEFTNLTTKYAATYQHLQIRVAARSSQTGHLIGLRLRLGVSSIDETGNYSNHQLYGLNGAVSSFGAGGTTFMFAGVIAGSSAATSAFGASVIDILDPFETTKNKTSRALSGMASGSGTDQAFVTLESGNWRNTSSLGQIRVYPSAGDFVANSRVSLYGIRSVA